MKSHEEVMYLNLEIELWCSRKGFLVGYEGITIGYRFLILKQTQERQVAPVRILKNHSLK